MIINHTNIKKNNVEIFLLSSLIDKLNVKTKAVFILIDEKNEALFANYNGTINILTINKDEIPFTLREIIDNNNKIHLLGRVSEKRKQTLLANCAALILPTDYEAFGIVNLEVSFYKKPILLSKLAIFENILDNEGIIYFANNIQSIYDSLVKFINLSENEKDKMGIINYKNLSLLQKYLTERGKLIPRRISGVTAKEQRQLVASVKRARFLALLITGGIKK